MAAGHVPKQCCDGLCCEMRLDHGISKREREHLWREEHCKTTEKMNCMKKVSRFFSSKKFNHYLNHLFLQNKICCRFMVDLSLMIVVQRNEWSMTTGGAKTEQF